MANVFQSVSSGLAELKLWYEGPLRSQFNDDIPIARGADKEKVMWSGEKVIKPIKVRRNTGVGATSDGGLLPAIGRQTTQQAMISAKYNYLRFGVTGPMIKASKSSKAAFVEAAAYELKEGYLDLKSDVNRQLSWNGDGRLAQLNAAAIATNVITVIGREGTNEDGNKFLDVGMILDIVTSAGAYKAQAVEITAISGTSTATVTLNTNVTAASGDFLVRSGPLNQEIQGLLYSLDGQTTTIYNIDRSLYPIFQGNVVNGGGGQLTLDMLQQGWNLGLRRGGAKYKAIYSDFDSLRFYQKLLTADKRFVNTQKGDGGFSSSKENYLTFNEIPWVADKDCPVRVFMLPEDCVKLYTLCDLEFADESGSMYIAQVSTDALEVRIRYFSNLFLEKNSAAVAVRNYISP